MNDLGRRTALSVATIGPDYPRMSRLAVLICASIAAPIHAADVSDSSPTPASDNSALQEIVVTARFKSENAQSTPIAITALSGSQIEARGLTDIAQVASLAPNVAMEQNIGVFGRANTAFIRGVGQFDFNYALEPGVAFYVDDVYFGTLYGNNLGLMDVSQVEVLRGPQGTLFGKNAEGGAIKITSVKPKGDDSGYVEVGVGSFNRRYFKGAFDTSIIDDKLFLRVSAASDSYGGYQKRIDYVCAHPESSGSLPPTAVAPNCEVGTLGGDDQKTARIALRWVPTDTLEANLSFNVTNDTGEATPTSTLAINNAPGAFVPFLSANYTVPKFGFPITPALLNTGSPYLTYAPFHDVVNGYTFAPTSDLSQWGTVGTVDWDITSNVHLKSITGYQTYTAAFSGGQSVGPIALSGLINNLKHDQVSQEFQVSGQALDHAIDWAGGAYYYYGHSFNGGYVDLPVIPAGPLFPHFGFDQNNHSNLTDKSAFLHGTYKTGDFTFELGARYTKEEKVVEVDEHFLYAPLSATPFVPDIPGYERLSRVDPKAGIQYQISSDIMAYVQYSTGFKSGGINPRPTSPETVGIPFGPEKLVAYEAGIKTEWLDHRLRANTAIFQSNYSGLQETGTSSNAGNLIVVVVSVGHARIRGVEEEITFEPIPGLVLSADAGILNYKTLDLGAADPSLVGPGGPTLNTQPPDVPKFTGNASVEYALTLPSVAGTVTPRLDYTYKSHVWNDAANTPGNETPAIGLLNARVSWDKPITKGGSWTTAVGITNVTNKFYYLNTLLQPWSLDGVPSPPREWLVTLRRNF